MKVWEKIRRSIAGTYMQQYLDARYADDLYQQELEDEWGWASGAYTDEETRYRDARTRAAELEVTRAIESLPKRMRPAMRRRFLEGRWIAEDSRTIKKALERVEIPMDFFRERLVSMIESAQRWAQDDELPFE